MTNTMSDFLQLPDSSVLLPRQFSSALFGRQDSAADSLFFKSNLTLTNSQSLMRQSSIDAMFAPYNQTGHIFRSSSMASESMIQSSIDETSTDYTFSTEDNTIHSQQSMQPPHHLSNQPMLPYSPASSASTSSSSSPNHDYDSSNEHSSAYDITTRQGELLSQYAALVQRELTASNSLPQFPQANARYQFNYEPDTSEVDDSELEFSPITTNRQVWSTPSHRRNLADGNPSFRQSSASGELAFTPQQQAMIQAWSNQQAKLVQLPPSMPTATRNQPDTTMGQFSHMSIAANVNNAAMPTQVDVKLESPVATTQRRPSTHFTSPSLPPLSKSYTIQLPPGVDPNEIVIGTYTRAERAAKIARYREKRARRKWTKKIMYDCRKSFADNRPRVGGRFIKMKD